MRRFQRLVMMLMICCLSYGLMASEAEIPTSQDVTTSIQAIVDANIAVVAAYLSSPQPVLPGCQILSSSDKAGLPDSVTFIKSDISSYVSALSPEPSGGSWLQRLMARANSLVSGPLTATAVSMLEHSAWRQGGAILDGTLALKFPQWASVTSLMSLLFSPRPGESVCEISIDVTVSGSRVSLPVRLQGSFLLEVPQRGSLVVTPVDLTANGYPCEGGRVRISMND